MKRIRCMVGIHKYYDSNKKSWFVAEVSGRYYFCEQNACIYCNHVKSKLLKVDK